MSFVRQGLFNTCLSLVLCLAMVTAADITRDEVLCVDIWIVLSTDLPAARFGLDLPD